MFIRSRRGLSFMSNTGRTPKLAKITHRFLMLVMVANVVGVNISFSDLWISTSFYHESQGKQSILRSHFYQWCVFSCTSRSCCWLTWEREREEVTMFSSTCPEAAVPLVHAECWNSNKQCSSIYVISVNHLISFLTPAGKSHMQVLLWEWSMSRPGTPAGGPQLHKPVTRPLCEL